MKRLSCIIFIVVILLSMSVSTFAGSIPEDLLHSDNAQIFFGKVVSFEPNGEIPYVEVIPTKKIKGDVIVDGTCYSWQRANSIGDIDVKIGNVYLFAYVDENNPTDIFEVTSFDTSDLKLKNVEGDMWKRFERYLNEGRYLEAEQERIERQNESLTIEGEDISLIKLIGVEKEDAEMVNIHYYGEVYKIDVDEFYKTIEDIVLTDIENVSLQKENEEGFVIQNGMYITVNGFDGYAFISDDCMVDKNGLHFSRLPVGAYTIKFIDRAKILALFEADESKLPFLETFLAKSVFWLVLFSVIIFAVALIIGFKVKKK